MNEKLRIAFLGFGLVVAQGAVVGCDGEENGGEGGQDEDVVADRAGAHWVLCQTTPQAVSEESRGCMLLETGPLAADASGSGVGSEYAEQMRAEDGLVTFEYYVASEADADNPNHQVTPDNGELAATIEADLEFLHSGELRTAQFETYGGTWFEAIVWGTEGCDFGPEP